MFRKANEELYMTQYEEMQLRKIAPLQDGIDPKQGERVNRAFSDKIILGTLTILDRFSPEWW